VYLREINLLNRVLHGQERRIYEEMDMCLFAKMRGFKLEWFSRELMRSNSVLQLLATLFVLPLSRRLFRIANMVMMEALWSELIWLVDWWAGVQASFFHPQNCQFSRSYGSFAVWIPILLEGLNCGPFYAGAGVC
jgi:hypothetical protein